MYEDERQMADTRSLPVFLPSFLRQGFSPNPDSLVLSKLAGQLAQASACPRPSTLGLLAVYQHAAHTWVLGLGTQGFLHCATGISLMEPSHSYFSNLLSIIFCIFLDLQHLCHIHINEMVKYFNFCLSFILGIYVIVWGRTKLEAHLPFLTWVDLWYKT